MEITSHGELLKVQRAEEKKLKIGKEVCSVSLSKTKDAYYPSCKEQ